MQIATRREGDVLVVALSGDFGTEEVASLNAVLEPAVAGGSRRIVFDLTEVVFMNSTAVGAVLNLKRRVAPLGGAVAVANAVGPVQKVWAVLGLDPSIPLCGSVADALARIRAPGRD
jgi:anti-anti-sigma factor